MRTYCRLVEIMQQRNLTVAELNKRSGVGKETIVALRRNTWSRLSRNALGAICGSLRISPDELFLLIEEDIWFPIALNREVTIHIGSNSFPDPPKPTRLADAHTTLNRMFAGIWDVRAFFVIWEHLRSLGTDISVRFHEHPTGVDRDPTVDDQVSRVFAGGNHIVIGSPVSNQFAEEVVSRSYGLPPFTPHVQDRFPYNFVWDPRRSAASSFGRQVLKGPFGIESTRDGKLVARYTLVAQGEGEDAALIVAYRVWHPPARRRFGRDDESIVIAILGYSGTGTLAGARVATDPRYAAALYPARQGEPCMRAVAAKYQRPPLPAGSDPRRDNRRMTHAVLVPDDTVEESTTPAKPTGRIARTRGRKTPAKPAAAPALRRTGPGGCEGTDSVRGLTKEPARTESQQAARR